MNPPLACPTCSGTLAVRGGDDYSCPEDHHYTAVGLALTTNLTALRAIWLAIRALEDDAASLHHIAAHYSDALGASAEKRRQEADAAAEAATMLRRHARRAQERLEALPETPWSP